VRKRGGLASASFLLVYILSFFVDRVLARAPTFLSFQQKKERAFQNMALLWACAGGMWSADYGFAA